ncbi:MAG: hypothetical protein PHH58_10210 [Rhodoferax sp.]|nr:hypothetical protein [Rhodoferax sp.]
MTTLERRIAELESRQSNTDQSLKVVFRKEGQTIEQARIEAGIPVDHDKQVLIVSFVTPPNMDDVNQFRPVTQGA